MKFVKSAGRTVPVIYTRSLLYSVIIVLVSLIMSGCLVDRLITLKNQLCLFDKNFSVIDHSAGGLSFIARYPVLYSSDIIKLTGAEPSGKVHADDKLVFEYTFQRKDPESNDVYTLSTAFKFIKKNKKYKLNELFLERNITRVFIKKLITDVLISLCKSKKSIVKRRVDINLADIDMKLIPDLANLKTILGNHDEKQIIDSSTDLYIYYFSLVQNTSKNKKVIRNAHVKIYHNKRINRITRAATHYLRYDVDVEFTKKKVVIKVLVFPKEAAE